MAAKILVVDDEPDIHTLIETALGAEGYAVLHARDAFEGLDVLAREGADAALLDIMMPGMDGLEMLAQLRRHDDNVRVIMMTAMSTPTAVISAMRDQACDFLAKPFDMDALVSAVKSALSVPETVSIEVLSARPEWIELRVPCTPDAIDPLERLMSQLKTDLPSETRESVTYAFREMLRNAIEHGGKSDPRRSVEVGYLRSPRLILYRIKDPGEGFSIDSLHHSALLNPENDPVMHERVREEMGLRPGGFGILIARELVDEMIYNESHNEVILIKYLAAAPAAG